MSVTFNFLTPLNHNKNIQTNEICSKYQLCTLYTEIFKTKFLKVFFKKESNFWYPKRIVKKKNFIFLKLPV